LDPISDDTGHPDAPEPARKGPAILLAVGVATAGAAWILQTQGAPASFRLPLDGLALLAAARSLTFRYQSPRFWLLAALVAFLVQASFDPDWDTARLALRFQLAASLLGAWLVWLSSGKRLAAISLLVILHFGGILVAVGLKPPANTSPSWLASKLWVSLYAPYLDFAFLERSYDFYSPEPNPELILWLRVARADGTAFWIKLPDRKQCATDLEFSRLMSLVDFSNQSTPEEEVFADLEEDRREAGEKHVPAIPMAQCETSFQYQEPTDPAKLQLQSFARHVAHTHSDRADPEHAVTGVKIYQVVHHIPTPEEFSEGMRGNDPTLYWAYYMGDFAPDGTLKPSCYQVEYDQEGEIARQTRDPFLYWLIPIVQGDGGSVKNYVSIHAGANDPAEIP
jgi:hypothetical protein